MNSAADPAPTDDGPDPEPDQSLTTNGTDWNRMLRRDAAERRDRWALKRPPTKINPKGFSAMTSAGASPAGPEPTASAPLMTATAASFGW